MKQLELETALYHAIQGFVAGGASANGVSADLTTVVSASDDLPLCKLAYWEGVVRKAEWSARQLAPAAVRTSPWLDLPSYDGYARERALRGLAGPAPNRFFFALAVRRLNDWVPQVRQAARATLPALARRSDPAHVADALCAMLPAWSGWGRIEEADREALVALAAIGPVSDALRLRVMRSTAGPMATVLSQCLRTAILDEHLHEIAAQAIQPAVRATAHRVLLAGQATWLAGYEWPWQNAPYGQGRPHAIIDHRALNSSRALASALDLAAGDRSPIVRNEAAMALVQEYDNLGGGALPLARRLAADVSPRVAARGVFVLQRLGGPTAG